MAFALHPRHWVGSHDALEPSHERLEFLCLRLQLQAGRRVLQRLREKPQRLVGHCAAVERLELLGVDLDRVRRIHNHLAVLSELQMRHRAVREENCISGLQRKRLAVTRDGLRVFLLAKQLVALVLENLRLGLGFGIHERHRLCIVVVQELCIGSMPTRNRVKVHFCTHCFSDRCPLHFEVFFFFFFFLKKMQKIHF